MTGDTQRWLTERARSFASFLEGFWIRLALSFAIIFSLVPLPFVQSLDIVFLLLFGTEFVLRVWVLAFTRSVSAPDRLNASVDEGGAPTVRRVRRTWTAVLLVIDLIALASFVPFAIGSYGARWLRVFRLTRLLLLVGYWGPLMRDLYSILVRRERARQIMFMGIVVAGLSFAGAVLLEHMGGTAVDVNEDGVVDHEDRTFMELLWWSFRQVQDPGNMLASSEALPVVALSLVLTVFGLFLVSFLIGLGTDVVRELLELSRLRPAGLHGHTVVVNITPSTRRLLAELMGYYQKLVPSDAPFLSPGWWNDLRRRGIGQRFLIVGNPIDPPDFLRQPELSRIVYRQRPEDEEELIGRADLLVAKRIVLLADQSDSVPDAETIRTLLTLVQRLRDRERQGTPTKPLGRRRVVIAEILDESNVPAAQAALVSGGRGVRGFIVPTEKLLALFFASVLRRPGLGVLLEELLTSKGHELYTCFFDTDGLGFTMTSSPSLGDSAPAAMDRLLERGVLCNEDERLVVPLGLLADRPHATMGADFEVFINPSHTPPDMGRLRGFVGIADNFGAIWGIASTLHERKKTVVRPEPIEVPALVRTHRRKTTRVLVCGFRPGSVYMLEELFRSDPGGQVLVVVEDDAALARTLSALEAHSALVRRGLMHGRHGVFETLGDTPSAPEGRGVWIEFRLSLEGGTASVMHLAVADWMASRHLVDLPRGFGHVADLDAVVFVASQPESADKRTTTALLKLEQLCHDRPRRPRIVAEVIDGRLATRLEQRFADLGMRDIRVFSIQELRAYFLFQSVVVPGFDTVYAELLGSWGQSFVHKHIDPGIEPSPRGPCTFTQLALGLREIGEVLIAIELAGEGGKPRLCVAPYGNEPGTRFDLAELRGAWVVAPDSHLDDHSGVKRESASEGGGPRRASPDGGRDRLSLLKV